MATRTDPLNRTETFTYDLAGNLATVTDQETQVTTFTYDALNRRTQASYQDGTVATFTYDAGSRVTQVTDTAIPIDRLPSRTICSIGSSPRPRASGPQPTAMMPPGGGLAWA